MDELISKLLGELSRYVEHGRSVEGFPNDAALDEGESVVIVASTFADGRIIYIWEVASPGKKDQFIGSEHSDGGVTISCNGPWLTLEVAKASYGDCPEGWS